MQTSNGFRQFERASVFGDHQPRRRQQRSFSEETEDLFILESGGVRRIKKDNIEGLRTGSVFSGKLLQSAESVNRKNSGAIFNFERFEIFSNQIGGGPVILYKDNFLCAAAERFDADGTGSGKNVNEAAVFHTIL